MKQIRHLLIPTVSYVYRPNFGSQQFGYWKDVQRDTSSTLRTRYSIFDNALFSGPAAGMQNSVNFSLSNNLEAKVRQKTDSGYVYNKVTLLQNVGITGGYNFAADSMNMSIYNITGRTKVWKFFDVLFNAALDPYGFNNVTKTRTKQYAFDQNGKLLRFTTGNVAINAAFSSNTLEAMRKKKQPDLTNGAERGAQQTPETTQERLPWNLNVYYTINFDKSNPSKVTHVQSLNFSGDVKVTTNWKIGMTSGFDFINKNFTYTSVNLYRDLHCWEARISWVPFGFNKSYSLSINLKTSMLSDIKIPRQRQWYDNL